MGAAGDIVAILWGWPDPLVSPPSTTFNNKILWVSKVLTNPSSDLQISARRLVGNRATGPAERSSVMGGPGPSIVNMPSPGCWQFTLQWSGHRDQLDLEYAPGTK